MTRVGFEDLDSSNLVVGSIYEGGLDGALAGEPISKVLKGVGNQGGIRISGRSGARKFVALYITWNDQDWPDDINPQKSSLTYFGDNKVPGRQLHETGPGGNLLFKEVFDQLHGIDPGRSAIPPFFLFSRNGTKASSRSVRFEGLCAPGYPGMSEMDDLVAVWKTKDGQRYQNYRATFAILNIPSVSRTWIRDLQDADGSSSNAPHVWRDWVDSGTYQLLPEEFFVDARERSQVGKP